MKTRLFKAFFIAIIVLSAVFPVLSVQAAESVSVPGLWTGADAMPSFSDFVASVSDGMTGVIRGIYVPNVFSYRVIQQPSGKPGYVSTAKNTVTQFGMAAQYNVIGLLAHNYLAGENFSNLKLGQEIRVVYGDGKTVYYKVASVSSYQALSPNSTTSNFSDLSTGQTYTAAQIFSQFYTGDPHLTFQTCIGKDHEPSWGRLFIIALPDETMYGQ
jgi:hypothetical protein